MKVAEDEKSTEEGSPSEEEDPKVAAKREKEQRERMKKDEKRRKEEEAKLEKIREEEAAKRAAEKEVRDAKKRVEQEKKEREQQKANKKEAERLKREEEKKIRDAEKLGEQARIEKENARKRSEEQSQKQKAEKEAEDQAKLLEVRTFEFERDRLARCEAYDKLDVPAVAEAAQVAIANPVVASGLAAAAARWEVSEGNQEDAEELLDSQLACLGSFFVLGKRPEENSLALSSGLRSRVKKMRTKIRNAAVAGEFAYEAPAGTAPDSEALEQLLRAARGEAPSPLASTAAGGEDTNANETSAKSGKKKAKAKAAPADEDLDALLQEFGMTPDGSDKKKKGGKKK